MGAGKTDLQIISYSTRKHIDSDTLSRIRSHAQHYVQGQRGRGKGGRKAGYARKSSTPKGGMTSCCGTIDFDTGKQESAIKCKRSPQAEQDEGENAPSLYPSSPKLDHGPGAMFEPFDAFPVILDRDFVFLFERYHRAWKWTQSKEELFSETVSSAVLCHSWLALAYNMMTYRNDVKSIEHEIKTIDIVYEGLDRLPTLSAKGREAEALSLTWAIVRMAAIKANQGELGEVENHLNALASIAPSKQTIVSAKFGDHLQWAIGILLLFEVAQITPIAPASLHTNESHEMALLHQFEAQGFGLQPVTPLLQSPVATLIEQQVLDPLKALTALCHALPATDLPHSCLATQSKDQAMGCVRLVLRLANFPLGDPHDGPTQWQDELQGCLTLSTLIFIWCFGRRNEATSAAISHVRDEVRQRLTPELICRVVHEVGRIQPLVDLMLWMLIVCGSTSEMEGDKLYYGGLIRLLAPDFLDRNFEELEAWGGSLPWISGQANSPVKEFWVLTVGRPITTSQEGSP